MQPLQEVEGLRTTLLCTEGRWRRQHCSLQELELKERGKKSEWLADHKFLADTGAETCRNVPLPKLGPQTVHFPDLQRTKRAHVQVHQILFPPALYPQLEVGCASRLRLANHRKVIESLFILREQCEVSTRSEISPIETQRVRICRQAQSIIFFDQFSFGPLVTAI